MGSKGRYVLRRLWHGVVTVLLIVVINFSIVHLAPGDAVDVLAGEAGAATPEYLSELRERFGLNQPLPLQFAKYLWSVVQLDLGYSFRNNRTVLSLILERLPATLLLMVASIALAFIGGVALGTIAATRVNSLLDNVISVLSLLAYAVPLFWLGLMLVVLFTLKLGLLPSSGMYTLGVEMTLLEQALDLLRHMILPVVTLALFYMATYAMLMRAAMLETYGADFVRTARAKGLSRARIARKHVLRNAILPVVTMLAVQAGALMGGAVVVEVVFAWPGLGRLAFNAIFQRDHNLLLGLLLLSSLVVVVVNLLVDLLYARLDPRIELEATK